MSRPHSNSNAGQEYPVDRLMCYGPARMSAHLALATRPDAMLIKPGMGFDESYALMFNEMARSVL